MNKETVALITGCSTGIGRELCKILTDKGYMVVATARDVNTIKNLHVAMSLPLDVTDKKSVDDAVSKVISRFHKIDLLVNNAGYSLRGALEEVDVENSKKVFDVNVFGILNVIKAVIPEMRKNKSGRIINIGSISGKFVQPINGVYCASKHAVEALTDALRLELHSFHIETAVIEPGPIETHFFKTLDRTSVELLANPDSCYSHFYEGDVNYRKIQQRTPVNEAAMSIAEIIEKKKLKSRYKIAVPFMFRLIINLPDSLKERLMRKH
jgi:NADP-dependent 3-hydroxy acid dehydrogenase YdfG